MPGVGRSTRQKVVAGAAAVVVLGGAAFAAVSATGEGGGQRTHAVHGPRKLHRKDLEAAAAYLGVPSGQLARELGSARSLARLAQAHGKTSQGLIDALVAARRARLAKVSAALPKRVGAVVAQAEGLAGARRGLGSLALFTAKGHLGDAAARYLGLSPAQLRGRLRRGETLAQIARGRPGRSEAGLLHALVASRQGRIATGVAAGRVTRERAARREVRLRTRMQALVERKFAGGRPPG